MTLTTKRLLWCSHIVCSKSEYFTQQPSAVSSDPSSDLCTIMMSRRRIWTSLCLISSLVAHSSNCMWWLSQLGQWREVSSRRRAVFGRHPWHIARQLCRFRDRLIIRGCRGSLEQVGCPNRRQCWTLDSLRPRVSSFCIFSTCLRHLQVTLFLMSSLQIASKLI